MDGMVSHLHLCGEHLFSKSAVEEVALVAGRGVRGDAHYGATVQHRSRMAADPTQPNLRQVHLVHGELHDELFTEGFAVEPGDIGENITTRGLDLLSMSTGTLLQCGDEAIIALTGLRNPCMQLDQFRSGLLGAVLSRTPEGQVIRKAGVMGVVLRGGTVHCGDPITVTQPRGPSVPLERV
ncbi:MAG: MOSC domain-containing protein [Acidimicrobiales bacterium]